MARKNAPAQQQADQATKNFELGCNKLHWQGMFSYLLGWNKAQIVRRKGNRCPPDGWAVVTEGGEIHVHPTRRAEPEEWVWVLAHCLLHLGFGHFQPHFKPREWNAACDYVIARFLADLKLGRPPQDIPDPYEFQASQEERLYQHFVEHGLPEYLQKLSPAGPHGGSLLFGPPKLDAKNQPLDWPALFGLGLTEAVTDVVDQAADRVALPGLKAKKTNTLAQRARAWFVTGYPLLGSLATGFELIEDLLVCTRLNVSIAAVDPELGELYINPQAGLDEQQMRFVIAHELLHVGLRHDRRQQGRDPYLWNVACDYVINGWLVEMGLGELPTGGALFDPELKGLSAEAIYDMIVGDLRRYRKLATMRGIGLSDILDRRSEEWWQAQEGCTLDEFYRRCLAQGLACHQEQGRGLLPSGLVEQIQALEQPPIEWDVELAQWFDHHFAPLEKRRSYARLSRRQSASPDIPRPALRPALVAENSRTFGVVLDTSGSMDRHLLAKALGAIASYSVARDVAAVRVVFCDAAAYDEGYMSPEAIADRVRVRGRGGTILQPGIDLLEQASDFPPDGPLLIITDGECDRLHLRREHAFLIPAGHYLPFPPKGPVFRLK